MIIPITQPIVFAMKSKMLQYLLMKRYFCKSSVKPPYAMVDEAIIQNIFFL